MAPDLGHRDIPTVARALAITWSLDALADVDRFATFLHERFPDLAPRIAGELIERTDLLSRHPTIGRRLGGRDEYRELLLQALGATYALQYRYDGRSILVLRVFHGRETR